MPPAGHMFLDESINGFMKSYELMLIEMNLKEDELRQAFGEARFHLPGALSITPQKHMEVVFSEKLKSICKSYQMSNHFSFSQN